MCFGYAELDFGMAILISSQKLLVGVCFGYAELDFGMAILFSSHKLLV